MAESPRISILNVASPSDEKGTDSDTSKPSGTAEGIEISEHLQKSMLRMTAKFLDESKATVNYKALRDSPEFKDYCSLAVRLRSVNLPAFGEKERQVFFINIYNALTVHSICEIQKKKDIGSTLDVENFWGTHAYMIGGFTFTLDDIEHGILRGNRAHPSTGNPVLKAEDKRVAYAIKNVDPRLHFALNCGAKSCPMVRVYNCQNMESAFEGATKSYLSQEVHVDEKASSLKIPQILQWYLKDFADDEMGMLKWIEPYVAPPARQVIKQLLENKGDKKGDKDGVPSPVEYYYDWSLNKA